MESRPSPPPDRVNCAGWNARALAWQAPAIVMIVVALLLLPVPDEYRALWLGEAMNFCHVPLFGLLTLALAKYVWPRRLEVAVLAVLGMILLAELVQPLFDRSASVRDAAYGVMGALAAYAWLRNTWSSTQRLAMIAILVAWPIARTTPVLIDAAWAYRAFPVLLGTRSPFEHCGWFLEDVHWQEDGDAVRLEFAANPKGGSGAILLPVVRDWTRYETLEVHFSFEGPPLHLMISVRDGKKLLADLPRFDLFEKYHSGEHLLRIDMQEVAKGKRYSPLEVHRVQSMHLIVYDEQPRTVRVHHIRLEGAKVSQAQ